MITLALGIVLWLGHAEGSVGPLLVISMLLDAAVFITWADK